jgi:hypothetical protein
MTFSSSCQQHVSHPSHPSERTHYVGDEPLADVDACVPLALRVPVPQLGDNGDRVQPRVLGQRGGDDLERLGERLERVALEALKRLRVGCEEARDMDLGRATAGDDGSAARHQRQLASYERRTSS